MLAAAQVAAWPSRFGFSSPVSLPAASLTLPPRFFAAGTLPLESEVLDHVPLPAVQLPPDQWIPNAPQVAFRFHAAPPAQRVTMIPQQRHEQERDDIDDLDERIDPPKARDVLVRSPGHRGHGHSQYV